LNSSETLLRASVEAQQRGDFDAMLEAADRANALGPSNMRVTFRLLECLLYCGHVDRVRSTLGGLEEGAVSDHELLCRVAEFYTHCADHESAHRCYSRAVELDPRNPEYLFALSAAEIATGDMEAAEAHLEEVIRANPHDYDAYRNRAPLRTLAKEYEDLGDYETSFQYLKQGADKRRSLMNYKVEGDLAVMDRLRKVFDEELLSQSVGCDDTGPIFIIGLPRSGTTLVDRILSSHSQVDSLGEINNFAYALMHTIGRAGDKLTLVDYSADIDFSVLGRRYVNAIRR
jgi:tetratricopeptide (TPR) repeat protein